MKHIYKVNELIKDNSGETIAEVVVAFAVLSIIMLTFVHGLAAATKAEINASNSRDTADQAMISLQEDITLTEKNKYVAVHDLDDGDRIGVRTYTYTIDVNDRSYTYEYVVYRNIGM